jgi:hypothetical protein
LQSVHQYESGGSIRPKQQGGIMTEVNEFNRRNIEEFRSMAKARAKA